MTTEADDLTAPLREALEMVRNGQAGRVSCGLLNALERKGRIKREVFSDPDGTSWERWEVIQ